MIIDDSCDDAFYSGIGANISTIAPNISGDKGRLSLERPWLYSVVMDEPNAITDDAAHADDVRTRIVVAAAGLIASTTVYQLQLI